MRPDNHHSVLTIDLDNLKKNYLLLQEKAGSAIIAPVVKANAYGLGVEKIAATLWDIGAKDFFVAQLDEGIQLRGILPDATIYVFGGVLAHTESYFINSNLTPVLSNLAQVERWNKAASSQKLSAIFNFDSGMNRLGMEAHEAKRLAENPDLYSNLDILYIVSHLACSDDPYHLKNPEQLHCFEQLTAPFPNIKRSLAASGGIFLNKKFHFDMVRPGVALYGVAPNSHRPNPMLPVASLKAQILKIRTVKPGDSVGYGASITADSECYVATVGIGYADGLHRTLSNRGFVGINKKPAHIIGRVSMDLITIDIGDFPDVQIGDWVEIFGKYPSLDDLAKNMNTIEYEILTSLKMRAPVKYQQAEK
jgi:alanine racemase